MCQEPDERIDIVNEHDEVIHTAWRSMSYGQKYLRCVMAVLINQENQICIFQRAATKQYWPSLGAFVGGGVQSGESYDVAIGREIKEEIGLDVDVNNCRKLGVISPIERGQDYFRALYEIRVQNNEIAYNPEDFDAYWWVSPQDLLAGNIPCKIAPHTHYVIERYYSHLLELPKEPCQKNISL